MILICQSTSSHIDTTGIQALVDTRNEVERWADRPIQFHFASILSPWTRRSLVAAGFGTSNSEHGIHVQPEIAPVTRYHDEYIADPQHSAEDPNDAHPHLTDDPEAIIETPTPSSSRSSSEFTVNSMDVGGKIGGGRAPLVQPSTPFFHFDLAAAVRAAEHEHNHNSVHTSYHTFTEKK